MCRRFLSFFLIFISALSPLIAKAEWNDSIRYTGEIGLSFSAGDHTPFWQMSNQFGLSSEQRNNGYLRLGAFHDLDENKRFSWGAGVDLAVAFRYSSTFIVQQLYAEAKYRCLDLMVGSKEIPGYISDPELATGNLLYSNNSRPIPQVRAGIFDYADIWGTNGFLGIKGYIAYGKFTDNNWIKSWADPTSKYTLSTLYHSKALFLRAGNTKKFPLEFEIGIEMATEFGGERYQNGVVTKMPTKFKNWIKALIPTSGGSDTPSGDQLNVEGNVLGNWNFALAWKPQADWSIKAYYQHFFEDHSMLWIQYPWKDGLYGIQAKLPKNQWVSDVVYEFIYMKDQSGPVYWDHTPEINEQVSGRDGYYTHYFYNGWQHWGMGIGSPLASSPIYNSNHNLTFYSTRFWAHHLGFKGEPTEQLTYRVLATYSKSWGTYAIPFDEVKSNVNLLGEVTWHPKKFKGWNASLSFGMDAGSLLGHNYGVGIKISKTGWFLK